MSLTMNRVIEAVITFALAELWVSFGWNKSGISVGVFVLAVLASPSPISPCRLTKCVWRFVVLPEYFIAVLQSLHIVTLFPVLHSLNKIRISSTL